MAGRLARTRILALVGLVISLGPLATARADDRDACFAAYEQSQVLRNDAHLLRAREQLGVCAASTCPEAIRVECARWLDDIAATIPSVVVEVREADGRDAAEARVLVDGAVAAARLDGKPVELDPGTHDIVGEVAGGRGAHERVVVAAGDRNRRVTLVLPAASPAAAAVPPRSVAPLAPTTSAERGPVPAVAWVLGGVAVVTGAVGGYLAISGLQDEDDLRTGCKPGCAQDDIDALQRRYLVADISLGVAIVSAGAFAWLVLGRPDPPSPVPARATRAGTAGLPMRGGRPVLGWRF